LREALKAGCFYFGENTTEAIQELVPIRIIFENFITIDTPDNNVVQGARRIDSRFSWHVFPSHTSP